MATLKTNDFAYIKSSDKNTKIVSKDNSVKINSSGDYTKIALIGDSARIDLEGYSTKLSLGGDWAKVTSFGYLTKISSIGDSVEIDTSDNSAKISSSGDYTRPRKGLSEDNVVGIVAGFHGGKPLIAALTFFDCAYDRGNSCQFGDYYRINEDVVKTFNGRTITEKYMDYSIKEVRFEAFEACINYRNDKEEEWYLGAAGEVATMIDNCIYLNAAHQISSLGFVIGDECFHSCSEASLTYTWVCDLGNGKVRCDWRSDKYYTQRVVPFLSFKKFNKLK